ncbi:MAG TPA: zinc-binding dehydrogenase [Cyclobacteriaceae bacterium]|nr:zinc-binding dehydrogenase [Cyclobacteriaceae bacterium]
MKAALFREKGTPLLIADVPRPIPAKDQVLIRIDTAALNHRDLWIQHEQAAPLALPVTLGSDGSGIVEAAGEGAQDWIGKEVIVNPSIDWGKNPMVQSNTFKILGFPDHGTFAEYLVIHQKQLAEKPEHLTLSEAAAVPLAALTAYRALFTKARLRPGERILVTGIGGGAALWTLTMAHAFGAIVYVTSSQSDKRNKALALGAKGAVDYRDKLWPDQLRSMAGAFDVIIDSAGGPLFGALVNLAAPGGRIVNFGRTAGNINEVTTRTLYWNQVSILGTTMGTPDEFLSMLDFLHRHRIKPVIDRSFALSEINDAFTHMKLSEQFGKILLTVRS